MAPLTDVLLRRYSLGMLWAGLFWVGMWVLWYFIHKVPTRRKDALASALWLGATSTFVLGLLVEVAWRGGRLPISW